MEPFDEPDDAGAGFERVPPQDLYAEQAVLGAMLLDTTAITDVMQAIPAGSQFYKPAHETIYDAILAVYARGQEKPDPLTVSAELVRTGDITRIGGPAYLHNLVQAVPTAANAGHYAEIIAERATRRGGIEELTRGIQALHAPNGDATEIMEDLVERVRAVRDRGLAAVDVPSKTLRTFLEEEDDEPDWVIPGVLARWDRLIVTAPEGGGKSLFNRQLLARTAAGLHPWKRARIAPKRVLLVDVENSESQVRPWLRRMYRAACAELRGPAEDLLDNFVVEVIEGGLDLRTPADRSRLLRLVEKNQPEMIAIGPLYKLAGGNPNDEEVARDLMSALESVRKATDGAALLIEAHAPHRATGERRRDFRPIGSSLWLRWPEFGFGLAPISNKELAFAEEEGLVRWQPWRGSRSERDWPEGFMRGSEWPWQASTLGEPDGQPQTAPVPAQATAPAPVPERQDQQEPFEQDALATHSA